ncbi:MAG: GntR family transcriptional regulator [Methylobacteriaceae bacterium]|jgi:DNA-binding FadR family transcriptional regulator|nr:GntR family transcriptional regulator [Methylobacteriaceae bacterium]
MMKEKRPRLLKESLAAKSVVDRVVDQIVGAVINGELGPGDKIPTEMELADSFQVGRNSVREAIKVLEAFGVLQIKRSEGTFVSSTFNKRMLDPVLYGMLLQRDRGTEIHDLRQVFDTGVLHVAIGKANDDDIKAICARRDDLRRAAARVPPSIEELLAADMAFHEAIAASAHNALISSVAGYIDRITIPSRTETMRLIIESGNLGSFLALHDNIVEVLESRDESRVAETVKDHYQFWRRQIAKYSSRQQEEPHPPGGV